MAGLDTKTTANKVGVIVTSPTGSVVHHLHSVDLEHGLDVILLVLTNVERQTFTQQQHVIELNTQTYRHTDMPRCKVKYICGFV